MKFIFILTLITSTIFSKIIMTKQNIKELTINQSIIIIDKNSIIKIKDKDKIEIIKGFIKVISKNHIKIKISKNSFIDTQNQDSIFFLKREKNRIKITNLMGLLNINIKNNNYFIDYPNTILLNLKNNKIKVQDYELNSQNLDLNTINDIDSIKQDIKIDSPETETSTSSTPTTSSSSSSTPPTP